MARVKKWIDGKEFYSKAIAVLTSKEDKYEKSDDPEAARLKEQEIEEACYTNRALCNLELSEYIYPSIRALSSYGFHSP